MVTRATLLAMLRETFATPKDARHWWRAAHPLLGNVAPSTTAKTAAGARRVHEILVSLKHGGVV